MRLFIIHKQVHPHMPLVNDSPCVSKYRMFSVMMSNDGQHGRCSQTSLPLSGLRQLCMLAQRELSANHWPWPSPSVLL